MIAKGYDLIAQRIKQIAAEHDIVMVENVPLARGLAKKVEIGHMVPVDFYQQVAEILSYVPPEEEGGLTQGCAERARRWAPTSG